jgi:RNA polymerase sigma-70 factor (sigma-E family)
VVTTGGRAAGRSHEDELLSRLYQQVTELQVPRLGTGYDLAAGLDRYKAWLRERTEGQASPDGAGASSPMASRASAGAAGADTAAPVSGETIIAAIITGEPGDMHGKALADRAGRDADRAVTALYSQHYRSLVRLAAFLVHDIAAAEELVQDSFVAVHAAWHRLQDTDHALSYLRQSVVNRSRSLRHRAVVDKIAPKLTPGWPVTEQAAIIQSRRPALLTALQALPARQREVLVLRYYADMSEAEIAAAMGISRGAVRNHTARAMSSLRAELPDSDD